jgi:Na+-driven multidrug efflux pump
MADQRHVLAGIRLMFIPLAALGTYLLVRSAVEGALGVALALVLATVVSLLLYKKVQRDRG